MTVDGGRDRARGVREPWKVDRLSGEAPQRVKGLLRREFAGESEEVRDVTDLSGRDRTELAVRQGFEPWIQLLGRITV